MGEGGKSGLQRAYFGTKPPLVVCMYKSLKDISGVFFGTIFVTSFVHKFSTRGCVEVKVCRKMYRCIIGHLSYV